MNDVCGNQISIGKANGVFNEIYQYVISKMLANLFTTYCYVQIFSIHILYTIHQFLDKANVMINVI